METARKVFVQIPSYRDKQLVPTLTDLVQNASHPSELRIVTCWQHDADETLEDFISAGFLISDSIHRGGHAVHVLHKDGAIVEAIDVHFLQTKGCGWARNTIQQSFGGEKYSLQIDAHHRFVDGWDTAMIEMLESLKRRYDKPLLTGYPPSFDPACYPDNRQNHVGQMLVRTFSTLGVVSYKAVRMPDWGTRSQPMRARFLSGGFIFSDGSFVDEVMNDADHFFSTEEIAMAVRAYTHGYDFFHPHRVLLWHQYNSQARKVWDDHTDERKAGGEIEESAIDRSISALERSLLLLGVSQDGQEMDFGRYGLGRARSIGQYERYAGLSFKHRGIRKEALIPTEPDESNFDMPEREWEDGLTCNKSFRVRISSPQRSPLSIDIDSVAVTVCARDGSRLSQRNLSADELGALVEKGLFEYLEAFDGCPARLPARYDLQVAGESPELSDAFFIAVQEVAMDMA